MRKVHTFLHVHLLGLCRRIDNVVLRYAWPQHVVIATNFCHQEALFPAAVDNSAPALVSTVPA